MILAGNTIAERQFGMTRRWHEMLFWTDRYTVQVR